MDMINSIYYGGNSAANQEIIISVNSENMSIHKEFYTNLANYWYERLGVKR